VPQAAGSATDNVARLLALELGRQLGGNVVVENRPGGALTIGIDAVAKAAPDGYTLGQGPVGALAITRHMVAKLPYDIERDLQPVAVVTTGYMLLAASPKATFQTVAELIDYARKHPGKLSNASSSNGSPGHVSGELFKHMTGTDIVHIPYKGGAPAIADLIAGNVQLMFESTNSIAQHVRNGRVRALAVSGAKRSLSLPEVPTLAEAGVPGYEVDVWSGVIAPAGLPRPILDRLNQLAPDAQVSTTKKGSAADFKPGAYVGVTSVKGPDGRLVARRIHALGPQVPQMHARWDSIPDSMMTNATLESTAQVGAGTELVLKNKDGEQKILVTPQTEYYTFAPGTHADLKPGEWIFTSAAQKGDKLVVQRITVSKDGVRPPQ